MIRKKMIINILIIGLIILSFWIGEKVVRIISMILVLVSMKSSNKKSKNMKLK